MPFINSLSRNEYFKIAKSRTNKVGNLIPNDTEFRMETRFPLLVEGLNPSDNKVIRVNVPLGKLDSNIDRNLKF